MADFYESIYNTELKERFMNTLDLDQYPPRWWERVFEKSKMFEKKNDKDLYSFTVPEIIEFYKFLDIGTLAPLIIYNTNLVKYGQWALDENLVVDGQNHFDVIDNEILASCLNNIKVRQSVLSYEDFIHIIRREIINDLDKFVFFCLFEGIKGVNYQEILELKMSDIDESNQMVSLCSGRSMYVSKDFIAICRRADDQKEYIGLTEKDKKMPLIPSVYIYKEKCISQGVDKARSIYRTITRNTYSVDSLNNVVSSKSLRDSGMIYYLNQRARKLDVPVEELMYDLDNWKDIAEKYQFNTDTRKRWLLQYKDVLQ